jgi:hypothetical protein
MDAVLVRIKQNRPPPQLCTQYGYKAVAIEAPLRVVGLLERGWRGNHLASLPIAKIFLYIIFLPAHTWDKHITIFDNCYLFNCYLANSSFHLNPSIDK